MTVRKGGHRPYQGKDIEWVTQMCPEQKPLGGLPQFVLPCVFLLVRKLAGGVGL